MRQKYTLNRKNVYRWVGCAGGRVWRERCPWWFGCEPRRNEADPIATRGINTTHLNMTHIKPCLYNAHTLPSVGFAMD